ncbi:MAG: DUF2933 domain-containing protein [Natronosporangium sp.]
MWWCYDKRVLIGLGVAGLGVLLLYPEWAAVVLPLLIVAACPLSMLLMMRMMNRGGRGDTGAPEQSAAGGYDARAELAQLREEMNILKARQRIGSEGASTATEAQRRSG